MDSSAPQARISSTSRTHVYCLPLWLHFRHLGFLTILGALAAFVLIYLLCLPFSSTSYCNSASWMLRKALTLSSTKNSSEQHTCFTEGKCVTTADSAAIIGFHLRHINFMVNLVEGTGLPPGSYFDFGSRYIDFSFFFLRTFDESFAKTGFSLTPGNTRFMITLKLTRIAKFSCTTFTLYANFDTKSSVTIATTS